MLHHLEARLHDPIAYALPAVAILIVIEILALRYDDDHKGYDRKDGLANIGTGAGAMVAAAFFRAASLFLYVAAFEYWAPWQLSSSAWSTWVFTFIGAEVLLYAYHRASHRSRIMWAGHQVHHSSEYFNLTVALRRKWAQWFESLIWLPLPLLGVPPWMVFTVHSLQLIYGMFVHTEKIGKLHPWVEYVMVTPSHHRVHHGRNREYIDKNYGSVLIVFDRMFGTFEPEGRRVKYGISTPLNSHNIFWLQVHEFVAIGHDLRRARNNRERFGYVFGPPGWKPKTVAVADASSAPRVTEPA